MTTEMIHEYMWSNGVKPVRSYKSDKPNGENSSFTNRTNEVGEYYIDNPHISREQHMQQQHQQEQMQHQQQHMQPSQVQYALEPTEKTEPSGKRDDMNDKLTERMPVASVSINPFLRQSNYLEDMETRDNFLIPKNSNQDISKYKKD
tara:strand:+ start:567 stop:1007 length:441 start_codon:yes stop_codon:yes gene_type:complete